MYKTLRDSTAGVFTKPSDVENCPNTHELTKLAIREARKYDLQNAYHALRLAVAALEHDLHDIMGEYTSSL